MKLEVYNETLPSLVSTTYSWTKVTTQSVFTHMAITKPDDQFLIMFLKRLALYSWISLLELASPSQLNLLIHQGIQERPNGSMSFFTR